MNVLHFFLKVSVLKQIIFCEIVERSGWFFEDCELCLMLIAFAVDKLDTLLNISDERDTFSSGLNLTLARIATLNAFLDTLFGIVLTDGFCTSETLLTFGSEGDVLAGFDFISGILHHLQELIIVLRRNDTTVNGLLEFLFPTRASLSFGVFFVAHALALRRRDHRQSVFLENLITELPHLTVGLLIASVRMEVYIVDSIEDDVLRQLDLETLRRALDTLTEDEYALICALYLQDKPMTEREFSRKTGIPQKPLNARKARILKKLKSFF